MTLSINQIIKHIRDMEYMSGVERDSSRIKATGEVFTPTDRVQKELNKIEKIQPNIFLNVSNTFIDPGCGDGQFLGEVLIRKIENESTFEQALSTIYGVDIMQDNVDLCRNRLLCGQEHLRHIVEKNIQCRDALKFGYNFKPMGVARRKTEEKSRLRQQQLKAKQEKHAKLEALNKKKKAHQKKLFGATLD